MWNLKKESIMFGFLDHCRHKFIWVDFLYAPQPPNPNIPQYLYWPLTCSQGKMMTSEIRKMLEKFIENQEKVIESHSCCQSKHLEKLTESLGKVTESLEKVTESVEKLSEGQSDLRKQLELHTKAPRCCLFSTYHHIFCFQGIARSALLVKLLLNLLQSYHSIFLLSQITVESRAATKIPTCIQI